MGSIFKAEAALRDVFVSLEQVQGSPRRRGGAVSQRGETLEAGSGRVKK